jgi:sugar/nucleoside kinase (ribokinase family)
MSIIALGTLALDTIKTPSGKRIDILGGSAAHFGMSARFFTETSLVANIGQDFPTRYLNLLEQRKIDLTSVIRQKGRTFRWNGEYQKNNLNNAITISTQLGVLNEFRPKLTLSQRRARYIFLANVDPDIQSKFLRNFPSPSLVGLDSMNYWINNKPLVLKRLLKQVDVFVVNDAEAKQLSAEPNLIKAAKTLHRLGPRIVVIKKGEHGVLFYFNKSIYCLPAYPLENIIDPTGAGDTFAGGFMGFLSNSKEITAGILKQAVVYGIVLASFNVEGFGLSRLSNLTIVDVKRRLKKFRKMMKF